MNNKNKNLLPHFEDRKEKPLGIGMDNNTLFLLLARLYKFVIEILIIFEMDIRTQQIKTKVGNVGI